MHLDAGPDGTLNVVLAGPWLLRDGLADDLPLDARPPGVKLLAYDTNGVTEWDSSLIALLARVEQWAAERKIPTDVSSLPDSMAHLLQLAVAPSNARRKMSRRPKWLARLGLSVINPWRQTIDLVGFFGEVVLSVTRLARGQSAMRRRDLIVAFEECGPRALPIVALINVLIGLIMGFIGAVQLQRFGVEIYVANLVGIAMTREMGAMMTAIIMSGRTGAAYAANIGTMKANDEISALYTTGLNPIDFLVLPRILALVVALPLLTIFADAIGILGGMMLGTLMLHIDWLRYYNQTIRSVGLDDLALGLIKSLFFGAIVGVVGCWCGLAAERHALGVGNATTRAVVLCIVLIIATDAIFTILTTILGI